MSDRRPTQRPANSSAGRSNHSGKPAARRPAPSNKNHKNKKRANGRFYAFLAILIVIILAVVLIIWKPWVTKPDNTNPDVPVSSQGIDPAAPTGDDVAPTGGDETPMNATALSDHLNSEDEISGLAVDQMITVEDLSINPNLSTDWKNILLLGTDQRNVEESTRSDTMIICSINTETGEIKITSLMRDIAVELTELGASSGTYRLNAANYFGGPNLTMKTINQLLDMNIDGYIMVNFYGFTQLAEALGGVEIEITEAEREHINHNAHSQYTMALNNGIDESNLEQTNVALTESGLVHLNGRQVLAYARIRKLDNDWGRTGRQQLVLEKLLDKAKEKSIFELTVLAGSMQEYFQTNMNLDDLLAIANVVMTSDLKGLEVLNIPEAKTYDTENSMFSNIDWVTNTRSLHNFIYY